MVRIVQLILCICFVSTSLLANGIKDSDLPNIGCAIYKFDDTFMSWVRDSIVTASQNRAKVTIVDSENSQAIQNAKVELFLNLEMDCLILNPVDRVAAGVEIDKAKTQGTPIVFVNRMPFKEDMAKWDQVYYVGTKAEQSGILSAQILEDYWINHPEADKNNDGILQYVLLKGEPGHQDAELRSEYSIKYLEDKGIKVMKLAEDTGMWDQVKGQEKMASFLASYGDQIEAVISNNDDMALGAIEALKAYGYFTNSKYMPVIGVDATEPALHALQEGTLLGTVLNDAHNQANAAVNLAIQLSTGAPINEESIGYPLDGHYVWIPYKKVTQSNYKEYM
ncbi:galactose ABC transporter substrate-binding protein [Spirochaeta cellobiosiphila]|uniref:galactose ABC transporter substrate-binding protein n=1 Tax=Spirochaeta cellobiosiphila TaxID=504483 RepID=UPI0004015E1B|nr:galactose ABC transporter substrate-binding protein [Spirochaeta cellobiosiphila]